MVSNWTSADPANRRTTLISSRSDGRLREECLNQHWFTTLDDAKEIIERWRQAYNQSRLHSSLGQESPAEYLSIHETTETSEEPDF